MGFHSWRVLLAAEAKIKTGLATALDMACSASGLEPEKPRDIEMMSTSHESVACVMA